MSYFIDVRHEGLNKYRRIQGADPYVVEQKAAAQEAQWDEMWKKKLNLERKAEQRAQHAQDRETKKQEALQRTQEAQAALDELQQILAATLTVNDRIDWDELLDRREFSEPEVSKPVKRSHNISKPLNDSAKYALDWSILDYVIPGRKTKRETLLKRKFDYDLAQYQKAEQQTQHENNKLQATYDEAVTERDHRRNTFFQKQEEINQSIRLDQQRYLSGAPAAIADYCDLVLSRSSYPLSIPSQFEVMYIAESRMAVVDFMLPNKDDLPQLKSVTYVQSRDEFSEKPLSDRDLNRLYDDVLYQLCLRTVHEIFESDAIDAIDAIVFNGRIDFIDRATGQQTKACIMSLQTTKQEFESLNLSEVDPKSCFKSLKGVGSSKLHAITSVAPIMQITRDDSRFVDAREVLGDVDNATNLAEMNWEEFEHLIRELFEREFAATGGDVKVTQASRDGGIDAVAFDPDPIRGGKIVIQAKRYTRTVGVSAVRDLYGTVMNEGAIKGILVSTADYGPDAYSFAKDKPLSLMNGANLLHLLERHGYQATVDLAAARKRTAD